jgi:hypothetical protein
MNHNSTFPNQRSRSNGGVLILILVGLVTLVYMTIQVNVSSHAYLAHGPEAEQTRNCIQQNGVWKAYREPRSNTFHWLCQDPVTGTILDMIVEKITETTYREKTAFRPKDGTWNAVRTWLERKRGQWVNPPPETIELITP